MIGWGAMFVLALGLETQAKPPQITTTSLPQGTAGTAYTAQLAAKDGDPPYQWSINTGLLPTGISLSAAGALSGTPTASGTAGFSVKVTDTQSATDTQALSIVINPAPLTVTTSSLPNGTVGTSYSQTLTASGGTGGYTWNITAGALAQGLAVSAGGTIGGTPTASGTANFTVKVTDSSNANASKPLSITVTPAPLSITTSSLPSGTAGTAYSQTLAASGGSGGYAWTITAGA